MGKNVRRAAGFSITALTAGALLAGCAPPPGGIAAPQAGGSDAGNAAPDATGSAQPGSDQSGSGGSDSGGSDSGQSGSNRSSSPSSTSKSAERIVVKTGEGHSRGEIEPEKLSVGVGNGNQVEDIEWSSWGGGKAVGKGTLELEGGRTYENAKITLRIPKTYGGDKQYTRYTVSAPGLDNESANAQKFQPTNQVVEEAERANEVYVQQSYASYTPHEQRPSEVSAGGVSHMRMEDVDWTSWNGPTAVGRGKLVINTCEPSCADGAKDVYENGTVRLTETKDVAGEKRYTKFTMSAPGLPADDAEVLTDQPIE